MAYPTRKSAVLRIAATLGAVCLLVAAALLATETSGPQGEAAQTPNAALPGTPGVPASPTPAPFTVVVDAGHGGSDGGAVGLNTGVVEAGLDLDYALCLKAELEARGVSVALTRTDENALGKDKRSDMAARKAVMNGCGANAVVSVHMNKFKDRSVSGPMAFYMQGAGEGQALAQAVIDGVCEALGRASRLANPGDYYMIRESEAPAVIIECGFLSNAEDEALIQTEEYRNAVVRGVADGVLAFLNGNHSAIS